MLPSGHLFHLCHWEIYKQVLLSEEIVQFLFTHDKFHLSEISSILEAVVEALAANTEVCRHQLLQSPAGHLNVSNPHNFLFCFFLQSFLRSGELSGLGQTRLPPRFSCDPFHNMDCFSVLLQSPTGHLNVSTIPTISFIWLPFCCQVPQPTCYWKWCSWQLGNLTTSSVSVIIFFSGRGSYLGSPCLCSLDWVSPSYLLPSCLSGFDHFIICVVWVNYFNLQQVTSMSLHCHWMGEGEHRRQLVQFIRYSEPPISTFLE